MLIAMPFLISRPVNAAPVNCEPWSVLKTSGLPCLASASSNVSTQKAASKVIDTRHWDVGDIHRPHLVRSRDRCTAQQIRIDLVARLGLGRAGPAIERLYPHPLHQRRHMPAADLAPLGSQQVAQQPTSGEGELQMQLVNPPHEREVGCRHRPGQVIDAPPTDVQRRRLLRDRQIVRTVDHRFALNRPALLSVI